MKAPWWMREARVVGIDRATSIATIVVRVHPLYVWWLRAVAVWTVLRCVRVEVRWPWRRGR